MASQRNELARYGISQKLISDASNTTLIAQQSVGSASQSTNLALTLLLLVTTTLVGPAVGHPWI